MEVYFCIAGVRSVFYPRYILGIKIFQRDNCERKRTRRSNDNNDDNAVTVDRRLRVYVDGDRVSGYAARNNGMRKWTICKRNFSLTCS